MANQGHAELTDELITVEYREQAALIPPK
jgi:hypothetical protein